MKWISPVSRTMKIPHVIAAFMAVLYLSHPAATADSGVVDRAKLHLAHAAQAEERGNVAAAHAAYRAALNVSAGDSVLSARIFFMRAAFSCRLGDSLAAEADYGAVYRDFPGGVQALHAQLRAAQLKLDRGASAEAGRLFGMVRNMTDSGSASSFQSAALASAATFGMARCGERAGDLRGARTLYQEVVHRWPHTMAALIARRKIAEF